MEGGFLMREKAIIDMIVEKNPMAAEELLRHYGPLMRYIIKSIIENEQDREECLSEAVLRVLDKAHLYDEKRGTWLAWITSVTRRVALNKVRSLKTKLETEELPEEIPAFHPTPEELLLQQERRKELLNAISQLSDREQLIFYRKYYYLQSTAQIASEIGITERSVEGRLYRIKKRLRRMLGGDGNA